MVHCYNRATENQRSGLDRDLESIGSGARAADGGKAGIAAALGSDMLSSRGSSGSENNEAVSPRPETSASGESSTKSESGGTGEDGSAEGGQGFDSDENQTGKEATGIERQNSRTDNIVLGGPVRHATPRADCLRGR